jgi:hypothetical protein
MDREVFEFMDESQSGEPRRAPIAAAVVFVLAAFQAWFLGRLRRAGDALVEAPTGSGKTLLVRTLVALDLGQPGGFTHAVVSCPQEQIERGFLRDHDTSIAWPSGPAAQPTLIAPARLFRAARNDGCGTARSIRRYLAAPERAYALACTHAALARLHEDDLPKDLKKMILIIDEAHHVPAAGLSRIARMWRERGGRLVFCSATPFRNDSKPVVLPGMIHLRRSLVEHMEEGWAPRTLSSEIVALGRSMQRVKPSQLTGDTAPPKAYTKPTAKALIKKWIEDGKPKTIVRVPPGRGALVRRVVAAFERAGARVLDATGVARDRKKRFLAALDAERMRGSQNSQVDVIVGILRILEGTDWPVCAAVYSIGIPRSVGVVVQLLGRALRKKDTAYPIAYRDLARLVFFVPCSGGRALSELSTDHSRHVLLVSAFISDSSVAQAWTVTAAVQRGVRLALGGRPEDELDRALDVTNVEGDRRARGEVQLALAAAHDELIEKGEPVSPETLMERVRSTRPDLPTETVEQVTVEYLASMPDAVGSAARARIEAEVEKRLRIDPQVKEAMRAAFARVLSEFRDATLESSPALVHLRKQIHTLTGGAMREFAGRLAAAVPQPLTEEKILSWADAELAASGKWPHAVAGDVRDVPGESWPAIDRALRFGFRGLPEGGSIAQLLEKHRGAVNHLEPRRMTEKKIARWARAFYKTHRRWPTRSAGAIPGTPFTWCAVSVALGRGLHGLPGGTTLPRVLEALGARNIGRLLPLTDARVARWARKFRRKHGRWPKKTDGQIDGAPKGDTWKRVGASIVQGRRGIKRRTSLAKFLSEVCGAPPPSVRRPLTIAPIVKRAREYQRKHGSWPTEASVDPQLTKIGETWHRYDRALRAGSRGLPKTTLLKLYEQYGKTSARRRRGRS